MRDALGVVGDHHHAIRGHGDDFFAQQRAAAALDEPQRAVDLVGAIDGQVELGEIVERGQLDAGPLGQKARVLRCRHAEDFEPRLHLLPQAGG